MRFFFSILIISLVSGFDFTNSPAEKKKKIETCPFYFN